MIYNSDINIAKSFMCRIWDPLDLLLFYVSEFVTGGIEEHEYFGEILLGIKQVIQSHLKEVQGKFYEKFVDLEEEVKQRDMIIVQLQTRIHELEHGRGGRIGQLKDSSDSKDRPSSGGSGSSNELPFMVRLTFCPLNVHYLTHLSLISSVVTPWTPFSHHHHPPKAS